MHHQAGGVYPDRVGQQVSVGGVHVARLAVPCRAPERICLHPAVMQVDLPIVVGPQEQQPDFRATDLLPFTLCRFSNGQRLQPRIVQ